MKFTVAAGELLTALRGPCDRAKISQVIPILKHVRVSASDDRISLLGHDLDSSSEAVVAVEMAMAGECCIPAEPLERLIAGLPKAAHVVFEAADKIVHIRSGKSRYKLPTVGAIDMPEPLSAEGGFKFTASPEDLEQLFARPRDALNMQDKRPICNGMYIHGEAGKIASSGTSGYMLMRFSTEIEAGEFKGAIVSRRTADEILKFGLGDITISGRIISITNGLRTYSSKLIDAVYPDVRRMITAPVSPITVDREYLIECVSRLKNIGDFSGDGAIDISAVNGELSISMTGMADGAEIMECDGASGQFICVWSAWFVDALKILRGESVELHIESETKPLRLIDPSEPSAINIVMSRASKNRKAVAA